MSKQYSPFSKEQLLPHPEMLEIKKQKGELFIGIPKETHLQEKRICLTPDAVAALTNHGHRIVLESGAGEGANYSDNEYSEAGAKISYSTEEVFGCNLILKVEPPTLKRNRMDSTTKHFIFGITIKDSEQKIF